MTATDTLVAGSVKLRLRPWRAPAPGVPAHVGEGADVAELTVTPSGSLVPVDALTQALDRARSRGYRAVVTPALPRAEWRPYLDAGFMLREHLYLLGHDLLDLPPRPSLRTVRVRRRHQADVLRVDALAFQQFWRFDRRALHDAVHATPSARFRCTPGVTAYALCGRAGDRGYVQRLAVHPDHEGRGIGTALVLDGLHWMRRWRVAEALVNTQVINTRATALYERLGFRRRRHGLAVFQLDLRA